MAMLAHLFAATNSGIGPVIHEDNDKNTPSSVLYLVVKQLFFRSFGGFFLATDS